MPALAVSENDVQFGDLTEKNIGQLRKLNEYLYPIAYSDGFYRSVLTQGDWSQYGAPNLTQTESASTRTLFSE